MARIASVVPDVEYVKDEQTYVGRPVRAFTGSNMADATNSLLLYRHLRTISSTFMATDVGNENAPAGGSYRVRWVSSPGAQFVWLGFFVYAVEPLAGSGPILEVKAELFTTAGALIDGPIFWSYRPAAPASPGHGRLPMTGGIVLAPKASRTPFAQTGWDQEIDTAFQGPRLLTLLTNQAVDVEVVFTTVNARLYSATVIEAFRPEVT